jgi:hypothetical protein
MGPSTVSASSHNPEAMLVYDLLRSILGGHVRRLGLLVWPDPDGLKGTDARLHLEVDCADGVCRELTCRTGADGETLIVEPETWKGDMSLSTLGARINRWSMQDFWDPETGRSYELFDALGERNFGIARGAVVSAVHLVQYADVKDEAKGVVIEFDSLVRLWSAPSTYGNYVSTNPLDYHWPSEIRLVPLS